MKKYILLFVAFFISIGLVGCNKENTTTTEETTTTTTEVTTTEPSEPTKDELIEKYYEGLDFEGRTINFVTHVMNEDNPYDAEYSDPAKGEAFQEFIENLEEKYNFNLEFKKWTGSEEDERLEELTNSVAAGTPIGDIIRIAGNSAYSEFASAGLLTDVTNVVDEFKELDMLFNNWQYEGGFIGNQTYGIQRNDGIAYPHQFVYHKDLIRQAGLTEYPADLWAEGKWTLEGAKQYMTQLKDVLPTDVVVSSISPYWLGNYAFTANGSELISADGTINWIDDTNILETANYYKGLHEQGILKSYSLTEEGYFPGGTGGTFELFENKKSVFVPVEMWRLDCCWSKNEANDIGVVPWPSDAALDEYIVPTTTGDMFGVPTGVEDADKIMMIIGQLNLFAKNYGLEDGEEFSYRDQMIDWANGAFIGDGDTVQDQNELEAFLYTVGATEYNTVRPNYNSFYGGSDSTYFVLTPFFSDSGSGSLRTYIDAQMPTIIEERDKVLNSSN